jgi:short subunit dehydrogenase-like uncharacterized protein
MGELLIYGATGYTGTMAADNAARMGLAPVLAGRNEDRLRDLGARIDCPSTTPRRWTGRCQMRRCYSTAPDRTCALPNR